MMLIEDSPEFLRCSFNIRIDDAETFSHLLLSVCSGSSIGFHKGPVWVATGTKCSPVELLLLVFLCGHGLSLMVYGSDDSQLVLQWVRRVKQQVLICV